MTDNEQRISQWRKLVLIVVLFLIFFIEFGVIKSFGVVIGEIVYQMDSDFSTVGLIFGSYHGISYFLAPFLTPILQHLRVPWVAGIGFVGGLSMAVSSLTKTIAQFGTCLVMSGISYAFVSLVAIIQFSKYIPTEEFAIAFGTASLGLATGMVVLPVLSEFLHHTYGWRGCMLILGGVLLYVPVLLLLINRTTAQFQEVVDNGEMTPIEDSNQSQDLDSEAQGSDQTLMPDRDLGDGHPEEDASSVQRKTHQESACQQSSSDHRGIGGCILAPFKFIRTAVGFLWNTLNLAVFTEVSGYFPFCLYSTCSSVASTAWLVFLIPHCQAKGFPLSRSVFLASYGGIGNAIGRILQGVIVHKKWLSSVTLAMVVTVINAIVFLMDPLIKSFPLLGVAAFFGGLSIGAKSAVFIVMMKELLPQNWFSTGYGLLCMFYSIGEPLGGVLSGWLSARFGFDIAFIFLGGIELVGTCFLIPTRNAMKRRNAAE